jgi:hypothetical protein
MVAEPQAVADRLFSFLDVATVPDISKHVFAAERERFGPADYKIWHTSRITNDSVGRGWTVPAGLISDQAREAINQLCSKLGYVPVDENWGTADQPADIRLSADGAAPTQSSDQLDAASGFAGPIGERLTAAITQLEGDFDRRWEPCARESFELIVTSPSDAGTGQNVSWCVDLAARTVTPLDGEESDTSWDVVAAADIWEQIISGKTNISVALRCHQVRYCDTGESGPFAADTRIGMLADLLGLASWGQARQRANATAVRHTESAVRE